MSESTPGFHARALAYFKERRAGDAALGGLTPIDVPELGTTIYFYPVMTHEERSAIIAHQDLFGQMHPDHIVTSLLWRARDEHGARLYRPAMHSEIRNQMNQSFDPQMMQRIVDQMNQLSVAIDGSEEHKKNNDRHCHRERDGAGVIDEGTSVRRARVSGTRRD